MRDGFIVMIAASSLTLAGCSREARPLGPTPPQTAPSGTNDLRVGGYLRNAYQVNQGGRYFGWYGCTRCHDPSAPNLRSVRLATGVPFYAIYRAIAEGHRGLAYGKRVPVEQLWQLTAYVADLPQHTPEKRKRQMVDQEGEPQGRTWPGPLR